MTRSSGFWRQVWILVWKNLLIKQSHWLSSLCELLLPILIGLLFLLLRTADIFKPQLVPIDYNNSSQSLGYLTCNNFQRSYSRNTFDKAKIVVIGDNDTVINALVEFSTRPMQYWNDEPCINNTLIVRMKDEQELEQTITAAGYVDRSIQAAVVFNSYGPNWNYHIRVPSMNVPPNDQHVIPFNSGFESLFYYEKYAFQGFGAVQRHVDEFIMLFDSGALSYESVLPNSRYEVFSAKFPSPSYVQDNFWFFIKLDAVLFFLLLFLWPFTRLVKLIVEERTLKIKEGLKMMGVTDGAIWFSWFLSYLSLFLITSIIIAAVLSQGVYTYTSFFYIFLLFFSFSLSLIPLAFLFTVLFKNARTAMQVSILGFIGGFVLYYLGGGQNGSASTIRAICLFSPACFGASVTVAVELELGNEVTTLANFFRTVKNISLGETIMFFFIDCVIYLVLAWYLGQVIPSEFGTTRRWWFVFDPSYWFPKKEKISLESASFDVNFNEPLHPSDTYEADMHKNNVEGLKIRKLRKIFPGAAKGADLVAVSSVDLDVHSGEVFALLGHNGAGKTTTISMLTGLIPISGGDASIFGQSILRNLDAVHQIIGVCPQQNVLWDALTVYEHLEIFGRLKGISRKDMKKCIMDMINEVGLTEKVHSPSKTLSGGQKRKLCVAIAFIGDPKVVFLDEPTSGMDVNSRRSTWDIIKRFKKDRVIILTTHFMDEADLLSDRIAIMAKGTVVCCGSSLFLKSVYGVGYSLVVSKNEGEVYSEKIRSLLKKHLEEVEFINDIGGEMLCRIPFSSSFLFPSLFREMDSYSKNFGIKNYGISVTTLEEVFIKVGEGQVAHVSDMKANTDLKRRLSDSKILIDSKRDFEDETKSAQNELLSLMKLSAVSEHKDSIQIFFLHCWALLKKRWHFIKRDKGTLFCLILLPAILMTAGVLGLRALSKFESTNLKMDFSHYQTPVPIPLVQNEYNLIAPILFGSYQNSMIAPLKSSLFGLNESYRGTFAEELFELSNTVKNPMYGAIADISRLDQQYMNVSAVRAIFFCNSTALHSFPIYMNLLSNLAYKFFTNNASGSIKVGSYPFPQTETEYLEQQRVSAILLSFFFNQALIFVPATYIVFIVLEKQTKAKHQQLISGVSIPAYWISNFLFDAICFLPLFGICIGLVYGMQTDIFIEKETGPLVTIALFLLYGLSSVPFSYFLSYLFANPFTARTVTIIIGFIFGPILAMVSFFLTYAGGQTAEVNSYLIYLYRCFPGFNLGDGLIRIAMNYTGQKHSNLDIAGNPLISLACIGVLYLILVILLEYLLSVPRIAQKIKKFLRLERDLPRIKEEEDSDVEDEKRKMIENAKISDDLIQVKGLRKVYNGRKLAVKDLWYSIPKGQCFGFLGINGAGKTTTLEMLSGDIFPTSGSAEVGGHDILTNQLAVRRLMGYCPQFDALFGLLTAREHLQFYARIKGVPEDKMDRIVNGMLHYLSLEEYADRPAGTYSGGNKRKLSVAIALIGDPPVVFLDEPSTGMDPVARRFMWKFISDTMEGRAVILTTHSMEECEALCHRIGIMVGGRLRCLGTAQHLKSKYGSGYQLDVNGEAEKGDHVYNGVLELFPGARLLERHDSVMKFQLSGDYASGSLADIFEKMEQNKRELCIIEYSVSQTSLEQIFIHFAKQQDEEKGVATGFQNVKGLDTEMQTQPRILRSPLSKFSQEKLPSLQ